MKFRKRKERQQVLSTRALRSEVQIHLHKLKTSCARAGFCAPRAAEGFGSKAWMSTCGIAPTASQWAEVTREHLLPLMGTWKKLNKHGKPGHRKATTKRPAVFTVLPCSHASSGLKLAKIHQLMLEQAQEVSGVAQIAATRFPLPLVCPGGETRAR